MQVKQISHSLEDCFAFSQEALGRAANLTMLEAVCLQNVGEQIRNRAFLLKKRCYRRYRQGALLCVGHWGDYHDETH
jgi:hypothetical protein